MVHLSLGEDGRINSIRPAPNEMRQRILHFEAEAQRIALETPSHEEGINISRVNRFIERQGLPVRPAILIYPEEAPLLRERLAVIGWQDRMVDKLGTTDSDGVLWEGGYIDRLGAAIIVRNRAAEEVNGPLYTECTVVHELAHADFYDTIAYSSDPLRYHLPRRGLVIASTPPDPQALGVTLEEGLPAFLEVGYLREEGGLPHGVLGKPGWRITGSGDALPNEYVWKDPNHPDGALVSTPALMGYGIELLVRARPELYSTLIGARRSVQHLRQVPRLLHSIRPGLYDDLRKLSYSKEDFSIALRNIKASLGMRL